MIRNLMKVLSNLFGNNAKINAKDIAIKGKNNEPITLDSYLNKKAIFSGSLSGEQTITLSNVKRFLKVYIWINFAAKDGYMEYVIDTSRDNPVYGGGVLPPFDEITVNSLYTSESSYNNGIFKHERIGFYNFSTGTFEPRNNNPSYIIYRIETYD